MWRQRNTGLQDGRLGMVRRNMGQGYVTMCNSGNLGADHASNGHQQQTNGHTKQLQFYGNLHAVCASNAYQMIVHQSAEGRFPLFKMEGSS